MTLPVVPGNSMSFSQINTELGLSSTATISLNDAAVRTLAGVGASPATIAITDLSGKSNTFSFTISTGQTNANLRTLAVNAGWPGASKVIATIGSGIYISSNSTGTPALTVNGSFPGGVELINNGLIVGMGGNGGAGRNVASGPSGNGGSAGSAGGLALSVSVALTLNNAGTVAGGGGGGGGGQAGWEFGGKQFSGCGGGGGGGGRSSNAANSSGGGGGTVSGMNNNIPGSAGTGGTVASAGGGGNGGVLRASGPTQRAGNGGAGGGWGASGSTGGNIVVLNSVGGPFAGGAAGGCITGNSNITYIATGTRLGSIS